MTRPRLNCSRTSLLPLYHCLAAPSPLIPLRKFADSQLFHPFEGEWRAWQAVEIRTSAIFDALCRERNQRLKGVEFAKVEEKSGGLSRRLRLPQGRQLSLSSFLSTSFISATLSASSLIASLPSNYFPASTTFLNFKQGWLQQPQHRTSYSD